MTTLADIQARYLEELRYVDDVAQIVLKGHLVMEELMSEAIGRFVLHESLIEEAKLQFHQKLALCRSMSVSDQNNKMWNLIGKLNSFRNHLAHSLNDDVRKQKLQSVRSVYEQEFGKKELAAIDEMNEDAALCMLAISGALGFLHSFLAEVKRFEAIVDGLNQAMNLHEAKNA